MQSLLLMSENVNSIINENQTQKKPLIKEPETKQNLLSAISDRIEWKIFYIFIATMYCILMLDAGRILCGNEFSNVSHCNNCIDTQSNGKLASINKYSTIDLKPEFTVQMSNTHWVRAREGDSDNNDGKFTWSKFCGSTEPKNVIQ